MRLRTWLAALALSGSLAAAAHALDPARAPSQYVIAGWDARDLSNGSVHALLQARDGYLWIGTAGGLVRFDGVRFTFFSGDHGTPELDGAGVSSLSEGPDGALYLGTTTGGVVRYHGGAFARLNVPPASGAVHAVLPRPDGSLWILAHARQVYQLRGDKAHPRRYRFAGGELDHLDAPLAAAVDPSGSVWIGTNGAGLLHIQGDTAERLGFERETVQALHVDRRGDLWLGTPHGLVRRGAGPPQRITRRDGLSHDFVTAIREDRDGNLWVGTAGGGLNRLVRDGATWRIRPFGTREGLANDHVRCLLEDREGNLWIGTAGGLEMLSDGPFVTYGRLEGLPDPAVTAVAAARDGSTWIGTNSAGLVRLRDGRAERVALPEGVGRDAILALHEARDGGLWVVADNGRVFLVDGAGVHERTPQYEDGVFRKVRLVIDHASGPIFFIPGLGPVRPHGRRLAPLMKEAPREATSAYVHAAYIDSEGTMWVGTTYGLLKIREGRGQLLAVAEGLPHPRVRSIASDANGGLWLATLGGLVHYKEGVFRSLTREHGLPENYLRLVLDDGRGSLWVASMSRIFRLVRREVEEVLAGRAARVAPVVYDTWDGLRATEPGALGNSPGVLAGDGRIWFATAQGASVVDPARVMEEERAPRVIIERLLLDGRTTTEEDNPVGRGQVTIDYATLAFRAPAKVCFRYRLDGFDPDWIDSGSRRTAYYNNLPARGYRFLVMASNRHGLWNGEPAVLELRLRPPFHRTPLFFGLAAAFALALAVTVHRLRVRAMHTRLTGIIHERTRIARELHDTLAQGLAGIGIQLHTVKSLLPPRPDLDLAREQLAQAASMIRSSLTEVRRSIWVLRAQTARQARDLPASLEGSLAQLAAEAGLASTFEIVGEPRPLSPDLERHLLRIAHEAVSNAAHHAAATRIRVVLEFEEDHVRLRVRDDGRGFDAEAELRRSGVDRFGLLGMTERARTLGGVLAVTSRPGEGAAVECRLPYHQAEERV